MSTVDDFNGFFREVISCYPRKQALEDRVLVDLNQFIPASESGYKYPVTCTTAVWGIIESAVNNLKYSNDYKGIVWDILRICPAIARPKEGRPAVCFESLSSGQGRKRYSPSKSNAGRGSGRIGLDSHDAG